jgi:hypothetical protein
MADVLSAGTLRQSRAGVTLSPSGDRLTQLCAFCRQITHFQTAMHMKRSETKEND